MLITSPGQRLTTRAFAAALLLIPLLLPVRQTNGTQATNVMVE